LRWHSAIPAVLFTGKAVENIVKFDIRDFCRGMPVGIHRQRRDAGKSLV
jgi:hypothetical protein